MTDTQPGTPKPEKDPGATAQAPASPASDAKAAGEEKGPSKSEVAVATARKMAKKYSPAIEGFLLLFTGMGSQDRLTRQMSLLFVASVVGAISVTGILWHRHSVYERNLWLEATEARAKLSHELADKLLEEEKLRTTTTSLGRFTLELKPVPGTRMGRGVVNMAEAEIMVRCDEKETRDYLDKNSARVRSQLFSVLTAIDREELISRDGKKKWKAIIIKRLNSWLPHGRVVDLYFSRLIVN